MRRHYNVETAFVVPGDAVPQQRPRFSTVCGHARAYDPEKSRDYKAYVRMLASKAHGDKPLYPGSVSVMMDVRIQIPKSWSKRKREMASRGDILPTTHGRDLDNIVKSVMDALSGVVYRDDSQVTGLFVVKKYHETPKATIVVTAAFPEDELKIYDPEQWRRVQAAKEAESDGNDRE